MDLPIKQAELIDIDKLSIRELSLDEFKKLIIMTTDDGATVEAVILELIKLSTGLSKHEVENYLTLKQYMKLLERIKEKNKKWFDYSRPTTLFNTIPGQPT